MREMLKRGYIPNHEWGVAQYRGKNCESWTKGIKWGIPTNDHVYLEHDDQYLQECLDNLAGKGIYIDIKQIE